MHHFNDSNTRWRAITKRDPAAHFAFIYGVTSTKIYCRPTCTARCARRANVVFYEDAEQARADGFRACQRCKPDDILFLGDREETVGRTLALLRTSNGDPAMRKSVKELAKEVGVTPSYLCRVFKQTMGMTIGKYVDEFEEVDASSVLDVSQRLGCPSEPPETGLTLTGTATSSEVLKQVLDHSMSPDSGSSPSPPPIWSQTESSTQSPETCNKEFDLDDWLWTENLDFDLSHSGCANVLAEPYIKTIDTSIEPSKIT